MLRTFRTPPLALLMTVALLATHPAAAQPGTAMSATIPAPAKTGYVPANGINYYYEIHGSGEPLLLLHGGLGSIGMFGPLLPQLAASRQVIAVDMHGHGRTELGDRPINYVNLGDDLAAVLRAIGYSQVDVLGYSFGAGAAFRLAVQHPELVRRVVLASMSYSTAGVHDELRVLQKSLTGDMAEAMKETPMYTSYMAVAPKPADFPRLVQNMGDLMRQEFDWAEDVKKLQMPVMLLFGDADMFKPEHVASFYKLLGGGLRDPGWVREHMSQNRLAILPDLTHYEVFMSPALVPTVLPFLNGVSRPPSWTEQVLQETQR